MAVDNTDTWTLALLNAPPSIIGPSVTSSCSDVSTKRITGRQKPAKKHMDLRCSHMDCTHSGTFPRQYELDRHLNAKHGDGGRYMCPVTGCYKGIERTKSARPDKLTSHIRSCHSSVRLPCLSQGCFVGAGHLDPDLLWAHMRKAHAPKTTIFGCGRLKPELAAVHNAVSPAYRDCPWWACNKTVPLNKVLGHMLQHFQEEPVAMGPDLLSQSHRPVKFGCLHGETMPCNADSLPKQCCCPVTAVTIVCPVCDAICEDHTAFKVHLERNHYLLRSAAAHFEAWKTYAQALPIWSKDANARENFDTLSVWHTLCKTTVSFKCPSCDWAKENVGWATVDHHLSMLADPEELRPYRREILKLHPGFIDHPVWGDLAKPSNAVAVQ